MVAGVLVALFALGPQAVADGASPVAVVVGRDSPRTQVTLDELREVFLGRRRVWADGSASLPVNLPADDPVRERFSIAVLGRPPLDLEPHWRRLAYEGVRPPPVLRSARAVCAFVAVEPAAIGYVPATEVDAAACRTVLTLDAPAR